MPGPLVGLVMYYALLPLAIAGTVVLRRRRVPSFPLWAIGLNVVCASALTFGQTRYRTTFEVSLVLLSAVALDALWSRLRRPAPGGRSSRSPPPIRRPRSGADRMTARSWCSRRSTRRAPSPSS